MVIQRKSLEIAFAKSEVNLQLAAKAFASAGAGADRSALSDNLEKARENCRQAHTALAKFDRVEQ
jgi:hypothetical protein